jgi:peptidyl-prolyl cis-trans isomerase C
MNPILRRFFCIYTLLTLSIFLYGCTLSKQSEANLTLTPALLTSSPAENSRPSETPSEPTQPAAAMVNGMPILLEEYEAELNRYLASLVPRPTVPKDEHKNTVIEELIGQALLAQAGVENGYTLDESQWPARLNALKEKAGGEAPFQEWLQTNGYTSDSFASALKRAYAAAWMRDKITTGVPTSAEQVHGRQILRLDGEEAKTVLARLQAGEKFADVAAEFDPAGGGDLGWFPKGYLLVPKLDEVFFGNSQVKALQPGDISPIIQSPLGFHIVEVIERQPERPLAADALQKVREEALAKWIDEKRSQAQVTINLP